MRFIRVKRIATISCASNSRIAVNEMNESRNGIWNETKSLVHTVGRSPFSRSMAAHFPGHPVHATSGIRSIRK